ncbi:MAG TPA: hypothetical protein VFZ21_12635 [Gemmatimonadaceae bacterium]|nr:hypothetical protein [Gemmatimonadaceae bacterium]
MLSFVNCEKYPPSLLFLAMTIGPGLIMLGLFQQARSALARVIVAIGRVPFLFYVAHVALLHAMAVVVAGLTVGSIEGSSAICPRSTNPKATASACPLRMRCGSWPWYCSTRCAAGFVRSSSAARTGG